MVDLSEFINKPDPTLEAVDKALCAEQSPWVSKNIGFGVIGEPCSRKIWYNINVEEPEIFKADTLRIFRNGHADEAAMAADLRKVPGIELHTHDPNREGKQYKLDDLEGRFTGRLDGAILGLIQAPMTWHVWEHKATKQDKFNKLEKLKLELGEKAALQKWNIIYYAQAQCNMKYAKLDRHYMTVSTPGLRQVTSVRTEFNKPYADAITDKARRIINSKIPMERINSDKDSFDCRFCRHKDRCHG